MARAALLICMSNFFTIGGLTNNAGMDSFIFKDRSLHWEAAEARHWGFISNA